MKQVKTNKFAKVLGAIMICASTASLASFSNVAHAADNNEYDLYCAFYPMCEDTATRNGGSSDTTSSEQ